MCILRFPPFGLARSLVLVAVALALLGNAGRGGATEPGPASAVDDDPCDLLIRDCRLTLQARRALQEDQALASLNLGVSVRNGVATVWGSVPSATMGQRAVLKLRQMPGLTEIRNELSIMRPEDLPPPFPRGQPPQAEPLPPDKLPRWSGVLMGRAEKPDPARETSREPPPSSPSDGGVTLLPPVSLFGSSSDRVAGNLAAAVERLREGDARFRRVQIEVRERTVHLRGTVARGEDIQELARAIARLPGVERVLLENVRIGANSPAGGLRIED